MSSIIYIGMDVHKESYTLCCYSADEDKVRYQQRLEPDVKYILRYIEKARALYGREDIEFICGYEAGCMGYSLYRLLTQRGVLCRILAPSTMAAVNASHIKTDKRDAANIARCLAFHTYSEVYVPDKQDESVKEYLRMRTDQKKALKVIKQQILALVLRHGCRYEAGGSHWTKRHISWLKSLDLGGILQESLTEYMITYEYLADKLQRLELRIEEIAGTERYEENVNKLSCLIGVKAHTALSVITESGDFKRFACAGSYASYLGLVPGEASSGEKRRQTSITKAGNSHLRHLLIESAQSYTRGAVGYKSSVLKRRQKGCDPQVTAYADRANERLRRKFYRMTLTNGSKRNVAAAAVARELACFMWGMMNGNIG